jgi:arsenite-transporting ATPase
MKFLQEMPRFVFFTGKGGVGKTSLACATAVHLAAAGRRVLLVSTDPASNVGQVFAQPIGNRVTPVAGVEGLDALEIDPESAAEQYRERILGPVRTVLPAVEIASLTEQLSGSCTTEIASFNEFTGFLAEEDSRYDHVVFDTAPTGHTIRLLQLPGDWTSFIDGGGDASCLGPMSGLDKHRGQYARALAALTDPTTTRLVLVARPQATSLVEAGRTASELAGIGVHATHLVVNAVLPDDHHQPDPLAAAIRARETAALDSVAGPLADLPQDRIPLKSVNMVGVPALRALLSAEDTADAPRDATPLPAEHELPGLDALVDELAAIGHGLVMCVGKGGVGKTTIAAAIAVGLAARGHQVHLTTTDPAAHLDATLTQTPELPSLTLSRVDPVQAIADYRARVLATQGKGLDADAMAALAEDLRSPCHQEIAVFQQFSHLVGQARRQFVVMDTAPTGHTLLLMDTTGAYHRDTVKTMASGVRFTTPLMRLQDPDYTRLVMVTVPEPTPVLEALAFRDDLARAGITPWAWVINQSLTAARPTAPLLRRRAHLETDPIDTVTNGAARVAVVPVLLDEPVGADRLLALTDTHTMTGSTP